MTITENVTATMHTIYIDSRRTMVCGRGQVYGRHLPQSLLDDMDGEQMIGACSTSIGQIYNALHPIPTDTPYLTLGCSVILRLETSAAKTPNAC